MSVVHQSAVHESVAHQGGCLCGDVRYTATAAPLRVTVCHCTFCQRFTGSAFLVEPIFKEEDIVFSGQTAKVFDHRSDGSKKRVSLHFCGRCGTTLYLSFERFPGFLGLCAGAFDDPNWFDRSKDNCRHIFTRSAQKGVVLPAGIDTYPGHVAELDGTPNKSIVFAHAMMVER